MNTITSKITISELARLFNISRPTMYKYIKCYENGELDLIPEEIKNMFDYIVNNEIYNKEQIYNHAMNKFDATSKEAILDRIKILLDNNEDFKELMNIIVTNSDNIDFNEILEYLKEIKNNG